jgi:peptidoglycan hydrolase-like protein with peptidoglycan-binding domain
MKSITENWRAFINEDSSEECSPNTNCVCIDSSYGQKWGLTISDVQNFLNTNGYKEHFKEKTFASGTADGKCGPETRNAIMAFQRDKQVRCDACVGPETWGKMKEMGLTPSAKPSQARAKSFNSANPTQNKTKIQRSKLAPGVWFLGGKSPSTQVTVHITGEGPGQRAETVSESFEANYSNYIRKNGDIIVTEHGNKFLSVVYMNVQSRRYSKQIIVGFERGAGQSQSALDYALRRGSSSDELILLDPHLGPNIRDRRLPKKISSVSLFCGSKENKKTFGARWDFLKQRLTQEFSGSKIIDTEKPTAAGYLDSFYKNPEILLSSSRVSVASTGGLPSSRAYNLEDIKNELIVVGDSNAVSMARLSRARIKAAKSGAQVSAINGIIKGEFAKENNTSFKPKVAIIHMGYNGRNKLKTIEQFKETIKILRERSPDIDIRIVDVKVSKTPKVRNPEGYVKYIKDLSVGLKSLPGVTVIKNNGTLNDTKDKKNDGYHFLNYKKILSDAASGIATQSQIATTASSEESRVNTKGPRAKVIERARQEPVPSTDTTFGRKRRPSYSISTLRKIAAKFAPPEATSLDIDYMAAISGAEAVGIPDNFLDSARHGDLSYGLWQINMRNNLGPSRRKKYGLKSNDELKNPNINCVIAWDLWKGRSGSGLRKFRDWSVTIKSKSEGRGYRRFRRWLKRLRAAAPKT